MFVFLINSDYICKNDITMETVIREQTVIRFRKDILNRARFKAKQNNMSLNAYLEEIVAAAVKPAIPKLPKDFEIDPQIKALSGLVPAPTPEQLAADDRLAYILGKGGE